MFFIKLIYAVTKYPFPGKEKPENQLNYRQSATCILKTGQIFY